MPPFYTHIQPENLPMPDNRIMALIQYTLREDADINTLSELVATNPSLTVQLLGMVNSAFFGFRERITTISHALVALGLKQLQSLVLCFAVKETLSSHTIPGFDINGFWVDSVRRGVAARQLGRLVNGPVEEAFSAGMLQDMGLLALFFMEPDKSDRWPLLRPNLPEDRRRMEKELFNTTHDQVGGMLAQEWQLPETYHLAIHTHHSAFYPPAAQNRNQHPLTGLAHLADLCNAVFTCQDKARALRLLQRRAKQLFRLTPDDVEGLLAGLPEQVREATELMKLQSGELPDFHTVMDQANQRLAEDNISYRELTWKLQNSLKERDEYAGRLEAELAVAREIQQSLQPDLNRFRQIAAFNIPAYHLSGDFYDFFALPSGAIGFCIGDVSGKGTAAALLMAKAISLFRCLCKLGDDIRQVVEMMNAELYETAVRGMFVTFAGGWLDPVSHEVRLVNMGHLSPIIIRGKKVIRVQPGGPPLGVLPHTAPVVQQLSIAGSRLFLYTDGFTEGHLKTGSTGGPLLGFRGFLSWLVQSGQMPIRGQADWLKAQCRNMLAAQSDDLTLMIVSGETKKDSPPALS